MATKGDIEGFVSSPLDGHGARHKDSYFPVRDEEDSQINSRLLFYCFVSETTLFYDVIVISCNKTPRSPSGLVSEWSP